MFSLLRTFITVYETRNFTQTAEKLFLSQPTISAQIKKLESELQTPLFIRKGKLEISPTKEADFLYPRCLVLLEEWADTRQRIVDKETFRESCQIAASNTCATHLLPRLMPHLLAAFPTVDFRIDMRNSHEVVQQLHQHQADLGLIEKPQPVADLRRELLLEDELILAGKPDAPWLLREADSGLRAYNDDYLTQQNLTPAFLPVNNNEVAVALLQNGVGQTILSKLSLPAGVPYRTFEPPKTRPLYLVYREEKPLILKIAAFIHSTVPTF
ncbi:transcriptional regulator, LysR family [Enterococcus canis]|uniref:Transcriptional regulator, LysR family n=1 Tax=Enterococcus canis TaxID=214095 RepID=A0A1L8RFK7_9ENTE|nr:LysR family transcriptional regulator [Enterococcus canis]OJG18559.1 transcriptional regulator, LysR family [Enterococcus canis]